MNYLDDDKDTWSKNFSNCEPVGNGRVIDGICIYTKKSYKGRVQRGNQWLPVIKGCNTSALYGYAGELGKPLSCMCINGKDYYRIGYIDDNEEKRSSNPKNSSDRVVEALFGEGVGNLEDGYYLEKELDLSRNKNNSKKLNFFNVTIQLLKNEDINLDEDQINFSVHLDDINKLETHIIKKYNKFWF